MVEIGVDEEGEDVAGEGHVIFGEGWEEIFDVERFDQLSRVGE